MRRITALKWFEDEFGKSKTNRKWVCSRCELNFSAGTYRFGKYSRCVECASIVAKERKIQSIEGCRVWLRLLGKMSRANTQKRLSQNMIIGRL